MKKIFFLTVSLFGVLNLFHAQTYDGYVGINTPSPASTLDVVGAPTNTSKFDGIIAPRITGDQLAAKTYTTSQTGAMVYASVAAAIANQTGQTINVDFPGYYYFDGLVWVKFSGVVKNVYNAVYNIDSVPPATGTTGITLYSGGDGTSYTTLPPNATSSIFIDPNGLTYTWDGTKFITYSVSPATEWYFRNSTTDALADKTNIISRRGYISVGENIINDGTAISGMANSTLYPKTTSGYLIGVLGSSKNTGIGYGSVYGGNFSATNSSTDTNLSELIGSKVVTNNNSSTVVAQTTGVDITNTNSPSSGTPTRMHGLGILNQTVAGGPSSIAELRGASITNQNVGAANITSQLGVYIKNGASSTGVPLDYSGVRLVNGITSTGTTNMTSVKGFELNSINNFSASTTEMKGLSLLQDIYGSGYVTSEYDGIYNAVSSRSTNSGTTNNLYGQYNQITHSSTTNQVNNAFGEYTFLQQGGKALNAIGHQVKIEEKSLLGQTLTEVSGIKPIVTTFPGNSDANVTNWYGINAASTHNGAGLISNYYGGLVQTINNSSNSGTITNSQGLQVDNYITGANSYTSRIGLYARLRDNSNASGSIANSYGARIESSFAGTETVTNHYGVKIENSKGVSATITNQYGLYINPVIGATNNFSVYSNGGVSYFKDSVGIGISNPSQKLEVAGSVKATNFISSTTTYPDYVFEAFKNGTSFINKNYKFTSLQETESFIYKNGHLPGVTSYEDVKKEGMTIDLAKTSVQTLEKVEELYLHVIELSKKIEKLECENESLKYQINK